MDEFFGLLPVLLIYLISATLGKKKRKNRRSERQRPMRTAARQERSGRRRAARDNGRTAEEFEAVFERVEAQAAPDTPCDEAPMHLHAVSQAQMERAEEGEDPCHAGGFDTHEEVSFSYDEQEEEEARSALAQDVLRGVIMSEILTRPAERMAMQRSRRRT